MNRGTQNLKVYKASAGSGKTFKLVSEYLKLCFTSSSPYKFRKILAITFTNKAAGEMKERIIDHLRSLSSNEDTKHYNPAILEYYQKETKLTKEILQEKSRQILTSILHDYTSFSISTIDKFTHKIIRSFARDLKLSADFELEMDPDFVLDKTIDDIVSLAGTDEEITDILTRYVHYLLQEDENWKLENNLKVFSRELLNENTEEHLNLLKSISPEDFKNIIQRIKNFCTEEETKLTKYKNEIVEICNKYEFSTSDFHQGNRGLFKLINQINHKSFEELILNSFMVESLNDLKLFSKKSKLSIPGTEEELLSLFGLIKDWILNYKPKYVAYRLLHKNLYNLSLINKLFEKFKKINQEDNVVLIAEFNKIISEVIKNDPAPFIYERIGERYQHILIDEFQDTSELQFSNLVPLIENSLGNGNTCLLVGDPKQAIYRWRGGDVDQFICLPELNKNINAVTQDIFTKNYHVEELKHNYRSGKNIVDFNNHFFHLAAATLPDKYRSIYATLNQESVKEDGYIELEIIEDNTQKEVIMLNKTVEKIQSSLKEGYNLKDICIITRNNKEAGKIAEHLHSLNIPVNSKESLFLKSSQKVNLVMSFIKYITYPNDKYAGFKIIELYENLFISENTSIKLFDSYKENFSVFNAKKYLEEKNISYSRNFLLNQNSFQLIDLVIQLFFPESNDIYLKFLLEYIFNQWQKQPMAIHELCEWWEEESDNLCIQSSNDSEAINLITIHKSKGLQYPVVIFPYASWKTKNGRKWLWIDLNTNEYPIETFLVPSDAAKLDQTNFSNLKAEEKSKSNLDDLNLLYVAFTRPEDRLYILSFDDKNYFKTIKPFLLEILTQAKGNENLFFKGEELKNKNNPHEISPIHPIKYSNKINWDERLKLSLTPNKNSNEKNEAYTQKMIGITIHTILEKSRNLEEAFSYLQIQQENNPIVKNHQSQIRIELENTYSNEIINNLNNKFKAINEATIIDLDGKSYRPDKIYFENNNITILDYKTGAKNEEHAMQLQEYADLLSQIGFKIEKKYLYYTKHAELLAI